MAIDERARQRLYRKLEQVLGDPEATILMERLPPEGFGAIATKEDLRGLELLLRKDLSATEQSLRKDLEIVEERLRREIHRVARQQTLMFTTIMAVLNGVVFTALSLALG